MVVASPPLPTHPFRVGEQLKFIVRWGLIKGGEASLHVEKMEMIGGRQAYKIISLAKSRGVVESLYKVRNLNLSWLDVQTLSSLQYEKQIREGKYKIDEVVTFDPVKRRFVDQSFRIDKNKREEKVGDIPEHILDVFSSLYYARTLPLAVGQVHVMDVYSGGKQYPLKLTVMRKEKIKTPLGRFMCLVVEPALNGPGIFINKGKKLEVWLTDDDRHLPVQMRSEVFIGSVTAEIVQYTPASSVSSQN
jgi:hypothetical protein